MRRTMTRATTFPRRLYALAGGLMLAAALLLAGCAGPEARVAPYAHTPMPIVREMLRLAQVGPADYVIDLGSGDGRLVVTAVTEFGARGGLGVDIDDKLTRYASAW